MSDEICFLITLLYGDTLLECALKVKHDRINTDTADYPMEAESRQELHALLPLHVQNCGPIVEVKTIFEIEVK